MHHLPVYEEADLTHGIVSEAVPTPAAKVDRHIVMEEPDLWLWVPISIPLDVCIEALQPVLGVMIQAQESWSCVVVATVIPADPEALRHIWTFTLVLVTGVHFGLVADGWQLQLVPEGAER